MKKENGSSEAVLPGREERMKGSLIWAPTDLIWAIICTEDGSCKLLVFHLFFFFDGKLFF